MSDHLMPVSTRIVHSFVNTLDLRTFSRHDTVHEPADRLDTPDGLDSWLREHGLLTEEGAVGQADLRRARELRGRLRDSVTGPDSSHNGPPGVEDELGWPMQFTLRGGRPPSLVPTGTPARVALGRVVLFVLDTGADGTWARLKRCTAPDCNWIFYDRSRPGRARWCEPELCGNRMKTRAYRARQKATGPSTD